MNNGSCAQVLEALQNLGDSGQIPWVLLRPRAPDETSIFDGDFDFLIDEERFDQILNAVFRICRDAGVSFIVVQRAAFKRQILLLDAGSGRQVTLELWPHAEFRMGHGRPDRAALTYRAWESTPAHERNSLLACVFVLHLHHKQKDLQSKSVQTRLEHFLGYTDLAPDLHDTLSGLKAGRIDAGQARARALAHLQSRMVPLVRPWQLTGRRVRKALRRLLRWPAPGTRAIVGPDGSGKTALLDALSRSEAGRRLHVRRFKRYFRRVLYHLVQSEPRNVRDEKTLWLILPVAWLCFSLSRWLTGWARPIILDRYFYDYFVRDVRHESRTLRRIAAYDLCSTLVPCPQRLIVASCPAPIIRRRKREMSSESIEGLYQVYLDQVIRSGVPQTLFCHTGIPLETSIQQLAAFLEESASTR